MSSLNMSGWVNEIGMVLNRKNLELLMKHFLNSDYGTTKPRTSSTSNSVQIQITKCVISSSVQFLKYSMSAFFIFNQGNFN